MRFLFFPPKEDPPLPPEEDRPMVEAENFKLIAL